MFKGVLCMVDNLICPNCSAPLPDNVRFCTHCGVKIGEKTDQNVSKIKNKPTNTPNYKTPDDPFNDSIESLRESGKDFMRDIGSFFNKTTENNITRMRYCPKCNNAIPNNVKFCTECGNPVVEQANIMKNKNNFVESEPVNEVEPVKEEFDQLQYLEKLAELRDEV